MPYMNAAMTIKTIFSNRNVVKSITEGYRNAPI